jgi:ABC-2 type transport system permease protein
MRISALIKRICKQMLRDKRTLALLFVAPLLILSLMYLLFNGETADYKIGIMNIDQKFAENLEELEEIQITSYEASIEPIATIVTDDLDGILKMENNKIELFLQNDDPTRAKGLQIIINQALSSQFQSTLGFESSSDKMNISYIYGDEDTVFFDVLSPILIGFFVFFFVFLISGIGFLKERTSGTLEKLMSTPILRWEIVTAYLIGFGLFAIIQTIIVVLFSVNVLDVILIGSVWNVILINLILALVALSLGTFLSAFAASEFQMVQFIPIVIVPQIFFSGIIQLDGMATWLQMLAKIMPIHYAADALKGVMYKGEGLGEISDNLYVLLLFAAIFILLNIQALKRYRKL